MPYLVGGSWRGVTPTPDLRAHYIPVGLQSIKKDPPYRMSNINLHSEWACGAANAENKGCLVLRRHLVSNRQQKERKDTYLKDAITAVTSSSGYKWVTA